TQFYFQYPGVPSISHEDLSLAHGPPLLPLHLSERFPAPHRQRSCLRRQRQLADWRRNVGLYNNEKLLVSPHLGCSTASGRRKTQLLRRQIALYKISLSLSR